MKRRLLLVLIVLVGVAAALITSFFPATRYIFAAYVFPGSDASLHGYPIIEPPEDFTGTWIDYAYTGRRLAVWQLVDGRKHGEQVCFDDAGVPYYVAYIAHGHFDHFLVHHAVPPDVTIPFFFPQRWLNPSLRVQQSVPDAPPNT